MLLTASFCAHPVVLHPQRWNVSGRAAVEPPAREERMAEVACFAGLVLACRRRWLSPSRPSSQARTFGLTAQTEPADESVPKVKDSRERSKVENACVKRLKDMVFMKGMKTAITSGEFALRLGGADRPGLVDYEGLCNLLDGYADRYHRDVDAAEEDEDAFKAKQDLRVIRSRLQDRLVAMTKAQKLDREPMDSHLQVDGDGLKVDLANTTAVPSKFMLYLRADETVDIDTALQESQAEQPLSRDLWERLEGKMEQHGAPDWMPDEEMQVEEGEKQMTLLQAKNDLERAYAKRAKVLKQMTEEGVDGANSTAELFGLDREISGRRNLALLANVDLIFEKVAMKLEKLLEQTTLSDWDISGRSLKLLVYEFALLDKQVAPYRSYLQEDPQDDGVRGLDLDELQMLETHMVRLARRVGLYVDRINQSQGFLALLRRQLVSWSTFWQKIRRGLVFQACGVRLLSQDLQHALRLVLKVLFLKHALHRREANVCRRAVKDLLVLVPFLIILLIPLSPPGHMLVFSLILKVYPDFVPSPFTEHRQNVMRIYQEIQPVSEKKSLW